MITQLEKMEERMEGEMVVGQEKMEAQFKEFKTELKAEIKGVKTGQEKMANYIRIIFFPLVIVLVRAAKEDFVKAILARILPQVM